MKYTALLLLFVAAVLPGHVYGQEADTGFAVRATLSAEAAYSRISAIRDSDQSVTCRESWPTLLCV